MHVMELFGRKATVHIKSLLHVKLAYFYEIWTLKTPDAPFLIRPHVTHPGWSPTPAVAEDGLALLILLPPPTKLLGLQV